MRERIQNREERRRWKSQASILLIASVILFGGICEEAFSSPRVQLSSQIISQGELAIIKLELTEEGTPLVRWLDREVYMVPGDQEKTWYGFLGADLKAQPGRYPRVDQGSSGSMGADLGADCGQEGQGCAPPQASKGNGRSGRAHHGKGQERSGRYGRSAKRAAGSSSLEGKIFQPGGRGNRGTFRSGQRDQRFPPIPSLRRGPQGKQGHPCSGYEPREGRLGGGSVLHGPLRCDRSWRGCSEHVLSS